MPERIAQRQKGDAPAGLERGGRVVRYGEGGSGAGGAGGGHPVDIALFGEHTQHDDLAHPRYAKVTPSDKQSGQSYRIGKASISAINSATGVVGQTSTVFHCDRPTS